MFELSTSDRPRHYDNWMTGAVTTLTQHDAGRVNGHGWIGVGYCARLSRPYKSSIAMMTTP